MRSDRLNKYIVSFVILFLCFFALKTNLSAQISGGVNYALIYNDNPFRLSDGSEEFINTYLASLGYQPFKKDFNLSYSFGLNDFRNLTDRSYNYHSFDVNYSFRFLDTTQKENISLGASYVLKQNNSGDLLYKYNAYTFAAKAGFYLLDNLLLVSGYKFNNKVYPSLYNLTFTDNTSYGRLSLFFQTNTALHFELQIGNRAYSIKDMSSMSSQHGGMGRMGKSAAIKSTNVTQMLTTLKLSQSLFENIGINLYYSQRSNLNRNNSISLGDFMYSDDDDLWDDPYSFEGSEFGSELLQILPWDMSLKLTGQYSNRRYKENAVDSLNVSPQRLDKRAELWLGITKEFNSVPIFNSLEFGLEYMHIVNNSSEGFFTYKNNLLLFNVGLSF